MIRKQIDYFNVAQIAGSGQCFRMVPEESGGPAGPRTETESGWYRVISGEHFLRIRQENDIIEFDFPEAESGFWQRYFDLDTDYGAVIQGIPEKDRYLTEAARAGQGIRILRQDAWEMILSFIISQQKTIPMIQAAVEALSEAYGTRRTAADGQVYHSFPRPEQLSGVSLEDFKNLKLGYRAKYIHAICQDAASGALDLDHLAALDYSGAMEYLTGFYGIGTKVANCICLFGLHHIEAFPVDTWIQKILMREYYDGHKYRKIPRSRLCETMVRDHFDTGCGGILQQYIFNYERNVRSRRD
ncbi:MAG TPA: DNA-3-methyladenine glycosylase 2 family protein [Candidatus Ventrisoma faecale]|nr:DNA-3-methyladenine glycosylase 2 family protein [Candidatus Ventrisoma faecale]